MSFPEGTSTVVVTLGGETIELGFTYRAQRLLRELKQLKEQEGSVGGSEDLPMLLWCCMDPESQKRLSVEDVELRINPKNVAHLTERLDELIRVSTPEQNEGNGQPAPPTKVRAGKKPISTHSGRSASTTADLPTNSSGT